MGPPCVGRISCHQIDQDVNLAPRIHSAGVSAASTSSPLETNSATDASYGTKQCAIEILQPPADNNRLNRHRNAENDARRNFGLESNECVLDDFMCALRKRLLYQGRLYIFERTLCFSSSVFGYKKQKIVPFQAVTSVLKRKTLGFPNSIEVRWGNGRREYFTSFVSREEAYKLIIGAWALAAPENAAAQLYGSRRRHAADPGGSLEQQQSASDQHDGDSSSEASTADVPEQAAPDGGSCSQQYISRRRRLAWKMQQAMRPGNKQTRTEKAQRSSVDCNEPPVGVFQHNSVDGSFGARGDVSAGTSSSAYGQSQRHSRMTAGQAAPLAPDFDDDDSCCSSSSSEEEIHEFWKASDQPPPPVPDKMQSIVKGQIKGVGTVDVYKALFSDDSTFFTDLLTERGDKNVKSTPWKELSRLGRIREMQFLSPIESRFGPSEAMCYQKQRYAVYSDQRFVFETDQTIPDIPYGDCFQVEARWNFDPAIEAGQEVVNVETFVMVEFRKSTMMRRLIEKGTIDKCTKAHAEFITMAQSHIDDWRQTHSGKSQPACSSNAGTPAARKSFSGQNGPAQGDQVCRMRPPGIPMRSMTPESSSPESHAGSRGFKVGSPEHIDALLRQIAREHWPAISRRLLQDYPHMSDKQDATPAPAGSRRSAVPTTPWQWSLLVACLSATILHVWLLWALISGAASVGAFACGVPSALRPLQNTATSLISEGGPFEAVGPFEADATGIIAAAADGQDGLRVKDALS